MIQKISQTWFLPSKWLRNQETPLLVSKNHPNLFQFLVNVWGGIWSLKHVREEEFLRLEWIGWIGFCKISHSTRVFSRPKLAGKAPDPIRHPFRRPQRSKPTKIRICSQPVGSGPTSRISDWFKSLGRWILRETTRCLFFLKQSSILITKSTAGCPKTPRIEVLPQPGGSGPTRRISDWFKWWILRSRHTER